MQKAKLCRFPAALLRLYGGGKAYGIDCAVLLSLAKVE